MRSLSTVKIMKWFSEACTQYVHIIQNMIDFLYINQILCNGFGFGEVIDKSMSVDYTKFL